MQQLFNLDSYHHLAAQNVPRVRADLEVKGSESRGRAVALPGRRPLASVALMGLPGCADSLSRAHLTPREDRRKTSQAVLSGF